MAKVFLTGTARRALEDLQFLRADAVMDALGDLERDSEAGHELRGRLSGLWSLRVGSYRVIYERRDAATVRVLAIRHRAAAYDSDPR